MYLLITELTKEAYKSLNRVKLCVKTWHFVTVFFGARLGVSFTASCIEEMNAIMSFRDTFEFGHHRHFNTSAATSFSSRCDGKINLSGQYYKTTIGHMQL